MNELTDKQALQQAHEAWRLTLPRSNALDSESAAFVAGYRSQRQTGQEPVPPVFVQRFLSDVLTAAGLIAHGRQSKALAERLADGCRNLRLYTAPPAAQEPLSVPAISHCVNQILGESGREQLRALARRVERQCALAWGVTLADGSE